MIRDKKVVVVMPAYNAARTLEQTYREVIDQGVVDRLIVVDDCSRDDTARIAAQLPAVRLHVHARNTGYGGNQKTCYQLALDEGADIVIMVHPDYQYTPKLIPAMASLIGSGLYHFVLGSRILGGHALAGGMPVWKYVANRGLTLVQNMLLGAKLSEYHTGYRAYSRELLEAMELGACSDDFVFDSEFIAQALWKGYQVAEVSCPTKYFPEASSINFRRSVTYGFGCLRVAGRFWLARRLHLRAPSWLGSPARPPTSRGTPWVPPDVKLPKLDASTPAARGTWIALLVIVLATAAIRWRLESIPLERDEGEYAYAGQLILQGVAPYTHAYNMKFPGTYMAYAGLMAVFGQTPEGVHRGLLVVNLASLVLLFLIVRRWFGDIAALVAAASFGVLAVSPTVLGFAGHATHFVTLAVLGGLLVLLGGRGPTSLSRAAAAGLLFGLALLMKQPGALFLPLGLCLAVWHGRTPGAPRWRQLAGIAGVFTVSAATPLALTCAWLYQAGVFNRFWFWTFTYAREYATTLSLSEGMAVFRSSAPQIVSGMMPLWALAGLGLCALAWDKGARCHAAAMGGWLLAGFLATCPGLYFRPHYFVVMLPAVAALGGLGVAAGLSLLRARVPPAVASAVVAVATLGCLGWPLWSHRTFFFLATPEEASRAAYGVNPFPESEPISDYLKQHCPPDATIAVIGSEPQIYFLTDRRSATGYIYTYGLMESQPFATIMQQEMIREITEARPAYLVFVRTYTSSLVRPDSPRLIFTWEAEYTPSNYALVGAVDVEPGVPSVYLWDDDVHRRRDLSRFDVFIWRRKAER